MPLIDMQDYTPKARIYWWATVFFGVWSLFYAIAGVSSLQGTALVQVIAGAAVAAVVGLFPVRIPGSKTSIAGAEIFIFLMLLLFGVPAAVLAATVEAIVGSWRGSKRWTSRCRAPAM